MTESKIGLAHWLGFLIADDVIMKEQGEAPVQSEFIITGSCCEGPERESQTCLLDQEDSI